MTSTTKPRFPIYIPSKSRAKIARTPAALDRLGLDYRIIVEEQQFDEYAEHHDRDRLLVLDRRFQDEYDPCEKDDGRPKGAGAARNFAWAHAIELGFDWHWVMDDNIELFARLNKNERIPVGDGQIFHAMETFVLRYTNIGMAGPDYWMFAPSRAPATPFVLNTRIFSCNLIRNDLPFRWRCRYNEDLILSIDLLKAGWATVLFKAFLQYKLPTQQLGGGNTEAFYAKEGTLRKSQQAVRVHPDVVRLVHRYGRPHHHADLSQFRNIRLIRNDDVDIDPDAYRSKKITKP